MARILLDRQLKRLGVPYRGVARRCVDCGFAFYTNLSRKELQVAVYSDVICSLRLFMKREELMLGL